MRKFKTESKKLLDLMINSIYTNREIFLRELISNASDAVDKLYFRSLVDQAVEIDRSELAIDVAYDPEARTVTVSDNGIGMTKDQLDKNLGTIAHSDSFEFKNENGRAVPAGSAVEATAEASEDATALDAALADEEKNAPGTQKGLADQTEVDIIGQFGVGFYSAFMVGKKVRVVTRAFGSDEAWAWESDGIEGYEIKPAERAGHGTDVIVCLKDDTDEESFGEYATEAGLTQLIRRYSNYVRYPIRMELTRTQMKERPADAGDDYRPEWETVTQVETVNSMVPIWKRRRSEVTQGEYDEFYKADFHDFEAPARTFSVHAEGALNYDALLFVPSRAPFDLYTKEYKQGLALYSSNVLIMDKCEELVPDYFNFVRGVVDSADLTLNVSRETLQQNNQLRAIARRLKKKIKSELASMRDNDREAYDAFFKQFGRTLKFGIYSSYGAAKDVIGDLLMFHSATQDKLITLDEYLAAAPADQKDIYFAAGDSLDRLAKMPIVTTVLGKGYDVLLCTEDIDEFCMMSLGEYAKQDGDEDVTYAVKNVSSEDLGLTSDEEKRQAEEATQENQGLFEAMADALGGRVQKVVVSTRLTDAPAVLTTEGPLSLQMEATLRHMPGAEADDGLPASTVVLEMNDKHPVFETLKAAYAAGDGDKVRRYASLLFDQALLVEGLPVPDPIAFAQAVTELMK